jgi:serine/threonine protein kinase
MSSTPPKSLHNGQYLRHQILGKGTYATVYLGTHQKSGDKVAIKKIRINSQTSENGVDVSAIRETKSLGKNHLLHQNVIKVNPISYAYEKQSTRE